MNLSGWGVKYSRRAIKYKRLGGIVKRLHVSMGLMEISNDPFNKKPQKPFILSIRGFEVRIIKQGV